MNIQEKLRAWAEEAYIFYSEKARNLDIDFYTQSDLTLLTDDKPVELMVVGINSGGWRTLSEKPLFKTRRFVARKL